MTIFDPKRTAIAAAAAMLLLNLPAHAADDPDATIVTDEYTIERPSGAGQAELTLVHSAGQRTTISFDADQPLVLGPRVVNTLDLTDGLYRWEARFRPVLDEQQQALRDARTDDSGGQGADESPATRQALPPVSGSLRLVDGRFKGTASAPGDPGEGADDPLQPSPRDQVIADDLIVQGSTCVGLGCVDGEVFDSDRLRLKANNVRIHFEDNSELGGFPANDWRLIANDNFIDGADYFAIEDATADRVPFRVDAGAPANSIYVASNGAVGFGTSTPVAELHTVKGNTPALRLDQTAALGFQPQVWDVAGNETNFFIRDATGGATLPFKIRPGSPSNAFVIDAEGEIAMGRPNAEAALHITRSPTATAPFLTIDTSDGQVMNLDADGNLFVGGAITQLSSRTAKENLISVAGEVVLDRLAELPIWTWNYLAGGGEDRHIGPVAEDFYASFGFGRNERSLSPSDVAGVALAASKALNEQLNREIKQRDRHIESLEARLERLERLLIDSEPTPGRNQ